MECCPTDGKLSFIMKTFMSDCWFLIEYPLKNATRGHNKRLQDTSLANYTFGRSPIRFEPIEKSLSDLVGKGKERSSKYRSYYSREIPKQVRANWKELERSLEKEKKKKDPPNIWATIVGRFPMKLRINVKRPIHLIMKNFPIFLFFFTGGLLTACLANYMTPASPMRFRTSLGMTTALLASAFGFSKIPPWTAGVVSKMQRGNRGVQEEVS